MELFFSLCDLDTLKQDTKNMDRLEDYLLSVALGNEDPQDRFFEIMQYFKDMQLIIENLINDAERSESNNQPDKCHLCNEKDEIIKNLEENIKTLREIKSVQKSKIEEF
jgi:hypothetical protein